MDIKTLTGNYLGDLLKVCIRNKDFFLVVREHLVFDYIDDSLYKSIYRWFFDFYNKNHVTPTWSLILQNFNVDDDVYVLLEDIKKSKLTDELLIIQEFEKYIKNIKFINYHNTLAELFNKGKLPETFMFLESGAAEITNFSIESSGSIRLLADAQKRDLDRRIALNSLENKRLRLATGIHGLDAAINGIETGELCLLMGDSGAGKTQFLMFLGMKFAKQGVEVLHVSAEGTKEQNVDRYDALWLNLPYLTVKNGEIDDKRINIMTKNLRKFGHSEIHLEVYEKYGTAQLTDVRNKLSRLKSTGHNVRAVIIDYLELFEPPHEGGRALDERFRQSKIARFLKNIATEFNVAVITATQSQILDKATRDDDDFLLTRFNLSEDKGKIRPCDLFITLNQTSFEKEERMLRLYLDKAREHQGGEVIKICTAFHKARFYDSVRTLKIFGNSLQQHQDSSFNDSNEYD